MEIVKSLSIILIVFFAFPLVSSLMCSEIESNGYAAVTIVSIGDDYTEETIILDYETNYTSHIYNNYSVELIDIYLSNEKSFTEIFSDYDNMVENCISLFFYNNSEEICSDFVPCISYSDAVPGFDVSVISKTIFLPYAEDVVIKAEFNSEIIMQENVSDLICNNNGVCEGFETYYSCSDCEINSFDGECIKQNEIENDGLCDPDCYHDFDCLGLCSDGIKNGNEIYKDFGGNCGYDDLSFCSNGEYDEEVEESIDCGGFCEDECESNLTAILEDLKLYTKMKMDYYNVLDRIFNWISG